MNTFTVTYHASGFAYKEDVEAATLEEAEERAMARLAEPRFRIKAGEDRVLVLLTGQVGAIQVEPKAAPRLPAPPAPSPARPRRDEAGGPPPPARGRDAGRDREGGGREGYRRGEAPRGSGDRGGGRRDDYGRPGGYERPGGYGRDGDRRDDRPGYRRDDRPGPPPPGRPPDRRGPKP